MTLIVWVSEGTWVQKPKAEQCGAVGWGQCSGPCWYDDDTVDGSVCDSVDGSVDGTVDDTVDMMTLMPSLLIWSPCKEDTAQDSWCGSIYKQNSESCLNIIIFSCNSLDNCQKNLLALEDNKKHNYRTHHQHIFVVESFVEKIPHYNLTGAVLLWEGTAAAGGRSWGTKKLALKKSAKMNKVE